MRIKKGALQLLGYSPLAERIYRLLLQRGAKSYSELSRLLGIHRPRLYKILPTLIEEELIETVRLGKRVAFRARPPEAIRVVSRQRAQQAEELVSEYQSIYDRAQTKQRVTVLEGRAGIMEAFEQLTASTALGGELYRYESPTDFDKIKTYYPESYWRRASPTGDINKFVITNEHTNTHRQKRLNRFSKSLPTHGAFDFNITEVMNDSRVLFIDYDAQTALVINDARYAQFQKTIFKRLFERL